MTDRLKSLSTYDYIIVIKIYFVKLCYTWLLISAPGTLLSAGVFVPSAPINLLLNQKCPFNTAFVKKEQNHINSFALLH